MITKIGERYSIINTIPLKEGQIVKGRVNEGAIVVKPIEPFKVLENILCDIVCDKRTQKKLNDG